MGGKLKTFSYQDPLHKIKRYLICQSSLGHVVANLFVFWNSWGHERILYHGDVCHKTFLQKNHCIK